ncbi:Carboxypeptidase B [Pseudolycoriella hygida]|uniref:Zinc carboxypeptidase A 1 n=1 Tax=Pseudolycoriella hygida TaxID=35572 RepID=A0A9Q0RX44_9DIPT|nr:Carboxypeptidase B [Pseudolycoriella hygida]
MKVFILCAIFSLAWARQFSYEGYKVWLVTPRSESQGILLKQWEDNESVDFWESISRKGKSSRIMVAPDTQIHFENFLKEHNILHELIIENVERVFERERQEKAENEMRLLRMESQGQSRFSDFNHFWSFSEINRYLTHLTIQYGDICHTETLGFSGEGRAMRALKIGSFDGSKPVVFFEAALHAREWIAPMTAVYLIEQLVVNYNSHRELQDIDIIIIPVTNPDGYEYSHQFQRLWRKTRSVNANSTCIGVDGNRNFAHEWRLSTNPCSETYGGVAPFTEREASIVRDVFDRYDNQIKLYVALHSYGQYFLYPWGYDFVKVDNWEDHEIVGRRFADAVHKVNGTSYTIGNAAIELYIGFGYSDDYSAFRGVDISTTIELPGGGSYGFDIPASRIQSVVKETWMGLEEMLHYVAEVHGNK